MSENDWHVIPINDLRIHHQSKECWCHPVIDEGGIVVHNAADGRELLEETQGDA